MRTKHQFTDYCVRGEIEMQALRQLQSSYHSPAQPFKPVPDGFEMDFSRKQLTAGEKE